MELDPKILSQLGFDCLKRIIKGDGACLYGCLSQHVFGCDNYRDLRKNAHLFIIRHWWTHYRNFVSWPFSVTVGVGNSSYEKWFHEEGDYISFLASEESMKSYNHSQLEVQNLANMLNIGINVFTHKNISWTWAVRISAISSTSEFKANDNVQPCWILHENNVHYDLLVARPQQSHSEAIQKVSLEKSRVTDERVQETHAEEMRVERLEVEEVPSEGDHDDVNKERISGKNQFLSPIFFAQGQKSR